MLDLKSPSTIAMAWALVPLAIAVAAAGVGVGVARLTGRPLGALTLPTGFLAGVTLTTLALVLGVGGKLAVAAWIVAALPGLAILAVTAATGRRRLRPTASAMWAAGAAAGAYAVSLAPLAGSGRIGVLGYVLNNDPSVHVSLVEVMRDQGARRIEGIGSSYQEVSSLLDSGYPLGSHALALFGAVIGNIEAFAVWTPLIALSAAMLALVGFAVLRDLGASAPFAAIAGGAVAIGYLPLSYLAQGGLKEVMTALAVHCTIVLLVVVLRARLHWRALLAPALTAAATVAVFGVGGLAWLAPAVGVVGLWAVVRERRRLLRLRTLAPGLAVVAVVGLIAAPLVLASVEFVRDSRSLVQDENATGNLLGPVPWWETLNVWLAYDYRLDTPTEGGLTYLGTALAGAFAIAGLVYAARRRRLLIPLMVLTSVAVALGMESSASMYFTAKTYVVLAPALGLATAAGVLWLTSHSIETRLTGVVAGAALVTGVLASAAMVYAGAWVTPKDRLQELIAIGERFEKRGPILVNGREYYAKYFLRGSHPWNSFDEWQPHRGFVWGEGPPPVPHHPDFDNYDPGLLSRFPLLLERKRAAGSRPPGNYRTAYEGRFYRIWQRVGGPPKVHAGVGDEMTGATRLDCSDPAIAALLRRASRSNGRVRVARPGGVPVITEPKWEAPADLRPALIPGFIERRGGTSLVWPKLRSGQRYAVWIRGAFASGVALFVGAERIGEVHGDLGLVDGWHRLGAFTVKHPFGGVVLRGMQKPSWQSGSRRPDITDRVAFVPVRPSGGVTEVSAGQARRYCDRRVDWIEII